MQVFSRRILLPYLRNWRNSDKSGARISCQQKAVGRRRARFSSSLSVVDGPGGRRPAVFSGAVRG